MKLANAAFIFMAFLVLLPPGCKSIHHKGVSTELVEEAFLKFDDGVMERLGNVGTVFPVESSSGRLKVLEFVDVDSKETLRLFSAAGTVLRAELSARKVRSECRKLSELQGFWEFRVQKPSREGEVGWVYEQPQRAALWKSKKMLRVDELLPFLDSVRDALDKHLDKREVQRMFGVPNRDTTDPTSADEEKSIWTYEITGLPNNCNSYNLTVGFDADGRLDLWIFSESKHRMYSIDWFNSDYLLRRDPRLFLADPRPLLSREELNEEQARAEILWTRTICCEKGRYIGWPTVCRLKNGDIIAVFSGDREAHVCPFGKVQLVRSEDDGETWSAPTTIANGPIDDRDAGIVQMPDGTLVVTYFTSTAYRTKSFIETDYPRTDHRFWWKRHDEKISDDVRQASLGYYRLISKDNGYTWSKPEKMEGVSQSPHGPILLNDGSLLQLGRSFAAAKPGTTEEERTIISAWRSTDLGATWSCLCPSVPDSNGENALPGMFHEPHAVKLPDGTLVGLVRYHGPDACMRQTVSKDGGKTWSPMVKTPMLGLPPHIVRLVDGKLVAVYGRRVAHPTAFGEYACISDDGGKTWDVANEILLAPCHNGDLGYPSSCVLADDSILTVYYQPANPHEPPCLMATKWRLKEE